MDFQHRQASHCESGVMSNLLRHHGLSPDLPVTVIHNKIDLTGRAPERHDEHGPPDCGGQQQSPSP